MKIGIVTGNLDPKIGGGARFCREILRDLGQRGCPDPDHWVILSDRAPENSFAIPTGAEWRVLPKGHGWSKPFRRHRNPLQAEVEKLGLSLVWFLGGGGFPPPVECPFLATVWDIQHRTHPFLPEMQARGEWHYRESKTAEFLPQASGVITGTEAGAQQLRDAYGIFPERILLAPHPAPAFFIRPEFSPNRPANPPYFVYPANFWPHKNHVTLIKALRILQTRGHGARLVLTGTGANLGHIRDLGQKLGLADGLEFRGHVGDSELAALYDGAAALVYASLSGPENLPPLEAMARGCPVINSDFPGAREQLGEAAVFVSPTDPEAWAEAMEKFLNPKASSSLRNQLIPAGERLVRARTVGGYVDKVLGWIDEFRPIRALWP